MYLKKSLFFFIISFIIISILNISNADWPSNKPIKIVMPFAHGGTGDLVGRLIVNSLQTVIDTPVVVEYKIGAAGMIGRNIVVQAKPDGHTLLVIEGAIAIRSGLGIPIPFDYEESLSSIGIVASTLYILVVSNSLPVNNIHELISFAKENPGKLNFGSGGIGANTHMGGEILKSVAEIDIVHIPYKGAGGVIPDLIAGRVDILVSTVATLLPYIKSGQVRPIVLLSDNRTDILPTVSTVVEEGYKNMVMPDYWVGLAAPPNTSIKIIDQLNHSVNTSMNNPKVKSYMKERGLMLKSMTPSESTKQITQEIDYWREFVKKNNIKIE